MEWTFRSSCFLCFAAKADSGGREGRRINKLITMKKKKFELKVPGGAKEVLLHTCCAPCSSAIIECLMQHGVRPTIYYCNPNIYPLEEYLIRKEECTRYAQSLGLDIVDADYAHDAWLCGVKGMENEPERGGRCLRCFKMRLRDTARYAHEHGFTVITTTLASSRWKSLEQIDAAGQYAVEPYPEVCWWGQNWRKGGLSERRIAIIKEYNFYNQQYCGCEFSMRRTAVPEEKAGE
jgi:predicted adenine nucleotide alpha hydrolase (AANH) superfamily ATPase